MALVERLMRLNSNGTVPASEPDRPHIAVRGFWAACNELIAGRLTVAQVEAMMGMDAADIAEFATLRARAPTGTTALATAQKAMFLSGVIAIFQLAELRWTGYATPAEVRAHLATV